MVDINQKPRVGILSHRIQSGLTRTPPRTLEASPSRSRVRAAVVVTAMQAGRQPHRRGKRHEEHGRVLGLPARPAKRVPWGTARHGTLRGAGPSVAGPSGLRSPHVETCPVCLGVGGDKRIWQEHGIIDTVSFGY